MCHLAMITHKETKAVNTLKKNMIKIEQKKSDLVQKKKLVKSLDFWTDIEAECNRVKEDELAVFQTKLDRIQDMKSKNQAEIDGFKEKYFK